jgi:hypothetical protein
MVEIFPASHRLGEVVPECQEIARSLMEFPENYFRRHECNITFDLFGITKRNINLLGEVMEGIATSIQSYTPSPTIRFLEFRIDNPTIKVRSHLSSFTQLVYSNCSHGTSQDSSEPYRSLKMWRISVSSFAA